MTLHCSRRGRQDGLSLAEMLVVLAVLAIGTTITVGALSPAREHEEVTAAAEMTLASIRQARTYSAFRGISHFVVLDPDARSVSVFADTDLSGAFEGPGTDDLVSAERWPVGVTIAFPRGLTAIADPLDASAAELTEPSTLPAPDPDAAAWGESKEGLLMTPTGMIRSVEATPQAVTTATVVFSSNRDDASAVALRGGGSVYAFRYRASKWFEL